MKKLSLDQLKEKVTVINEKELKQAISGGEEEHNFIWWAGYYTGSAIDWVRDQIEELMED
ncbi:MAG: hypothetical protein AAF611_06335 [Bacteroidota bacterium]